MPPAADRLESLFAEALALAVEQRAAYLDRECADDHVLRNQLDALLRAHERTHHLLDQPAPGSPEQTALYVDGEQPGLVIAGRYKLLELIGEGGMGTVWLAEQIEPVRRKVALKLIKPGMDTKSVLARFESERQALALMDHQNIAKVLDGGLTSQGRPFFVMEYVKGIPITNYCDNARLSIPHRLQLFIQVCQAVQHAHQKGIIHRDLKPSNILVAPYDDKPVPKIIDFGLAKAIHQSLTERTLHTAHEAILGTPLYMSPEQAQLNNLDVDTRSDIYSLGVLLYELLTGTTPLEKQRFKQAAWDEVRRMIREEEPPRPSTRLSSIDTLPSLAAGRQTEPLKLTRLIQGELDWIVMKALEKDRTRRYETANGFARDIERYLNDDVVEARPASTGYRLKKFISRHRGVVVATSLIILALLVGFIVSSYGFYQAEIQRQQREGAEKALLQQFQVAEQNAAEAKLQKKLADQEASAARQAEAETKAFGQFLIEDVLAVARPQGVRGGLGRDVTIREALEKCSPILPMRFPGKPLAEALAQHNLGVTFRLIGDLPRAEWHLQRAATLREKHLGTEHIDTLSSMNSLAVVLNEAGKSQAAIALFEKVLQAGAPLLEANTRFTIENNLSLAYRAMGQWKKSLAMQKENLQRGEALLGKDHEDVLTTRVNYAAALHDAGELERSRELYAQVLARQEATLGAKHPTTLHTKANLATLYLDLDDIVTARRMLEDVVAQEVVLLGRDHHSTLASQMNLAAIYREAGELERSIALYRDTIERQKKQLGAEHRDVYHSLHNLAAALRVKGQLLEAITLFKTVIEYRTRHLGPMHPATLASRSQLAGCYLDQNQYATARAQYQDILTLELQTWGDDHPEVLKTHSNLALTYFEEGKLQEALPLYQQLLKHRQQALGHQHESTLTTMHRLAVLHMRLKQYDQADPLFQDLLQRSALRFGKEHPETLSITNNYATMCFSWNKLDRSIPLFESLLAIDQKLHGPDHRSTLLAEGNLAMNYLTAGRTADALPLVRDLIARGPSHPFPQYPLLLKELSSLLIDLQQWKEAEPLLLERYTLAQKKQDSQQMLSLADQLIQVYQKTQQPEPATRWQTEKEKLTKGAAGK